MRPLSIVAIYITLNIKSAGSTVFSEWRSDNFDAFGTITMDHILLMLTLSSFLPHPINFIIDLVVFSWLSFYPRVWLYHLLSPQVPNRIQRERLHDIYAE